MIGGGVGALKQGFYDGLNLYRTINMSQEGVEFSNQEFIERWDLTNCT